MTLADWVTPEIYDFAMEVKELRLNLKVYSDEMIKLRGGKCIIISRICIYIYIFVCICICVYLFREDIIITAVITIVVIIVIVIVIIIIIIIIIINTIIVTIIIIIIIIIIITVIIIIIIIILKISRYKSNVRYEISPTLCRHWLSLVWLNTLSLTKA